MKFVWPFAGLTSDINHVFQQEVDHCSTASHTCSERRYQVHIWGISMGSEHKFQRWGEIPNEGFKLSAHQWNSFKALQNFLCVDYHSLNNTFTFWDTEALPKIQRWLTLKSALWVSSYSSPFSGRPMQVSECETSF